jgi:4-carboxymuconolactone decarboxylase
VEWFSTAREVYGPEDEIPGDFTQAGDDRRRLRRRPAGLGLGPAAASALDPKTAALLQMGVSVAVGSSAVCLEWSAGRALAAGASEDEIADVLLAIAPVAGLGRVVCAAPDLATALGYDIAAALEERDDH